MIRKNQEYRWIPSLYFSQGLAYSVILIVVTVMYKNLGISNSKITLYTSLLLFPWSIKFLLSPLLEIFSVKKYILVIIQTTTSLLFLLLLFALASYQYLFLSLIILGCIAILGSAFDITSDGIYLDFLTSKKQAYFVGIKTSFYQFARLFCQGGLLILAGLLMHTMSKINAWKISYLLLAVIIYGLSMYHLWTLPKKEIKKHSKKQIIINVFHKNMQSFCSQKNLIYIITFLIFYNSAEAQLIKIVPLYLLDSSAHGGAHLSINQVGLLFGGIGTASMLIGAIISGMLIARYTLRKIILPITLFVTIINIGYLVISSYHTNHLSWLTLVIILAQFGFGLGNSAFMSKLLDLSSNKPYPMSFYALATAIMAVGMIIPGAVSGYIQQILGYQRFFIWIVLLGILILLFTYAFNRIETNEYQKA